MAGIAAIVQARMGSSRLPGKVMMKLEGRPVLEHVLQRAAGIEGVDNVVIATSTSSSDDLIADYAAENNWDCCRGSEADVLDRYYNAAKSCKAECVIRITSDCPLLDPEVSSEVVQYFHRCQPVDYVSNTNPVRTFPRGLDTEIFHMDTLERAWAFDQNPATREHVTPCMYQNPGVFTTSCYTGEHDYSDHRWTLDTQEDFNLIRAVYSHFGCTIVSWMEIVSFLDTHPELKDINSAVSQKQTPGSA